MATADNLKIAQQLLATMQQITAQVEKQTEAYHAQAQLVDALCKAQECFGKIDADKVKEVTSSLKEAQEKTKEFGASIEEVAEEKASKLQGALKKVSDWASKLSISDEFLNGFKSGWKLSTNFFKNIMSLGGSAIGLLKDMGGILRSLPGRLLGFFQGAGGGEIDPYRLALEDLRKEFGNLEIGTSLAIRNMTESTKNLGESGLALRAVFGGGREGLVKMLQENMELFKGMGPLGDRLAESIRGAEGEFTLLRKATNLSAEAMKSLQLAAEEGGISTADAVRGLTKDIAQAEKAFGISAKLFGRDLDFMMKDTATFGIMAPKEMLKVSAYARKLGVSMETLKKVIEKSMNFEDAAQQAAKLSEAFGLALDPMKQMMETDPTKKIDNIRQAFFKTGQTFEKMTPQARKYLAEQAGMSEEEARIAFSQKNRAMSGAQIDAQMKKQQKTQITQAEAMQQLAKSIERVLKSGDKMEGSFFEVFAKGFEKGIRSTKEFRDVARALQASLRHVFLAGRDVGRMFVKEFPGIKQMLEALADMFNPRRFRDLMKNVVEEFKKFFKLLQTDPRAGVTEFMKNMKKIFFDFFNKGTPAGAKFLDGLKTFYKTIGIIFVQGLKYALNALKDILGVVIGFIRDPSSLKQMASGVGTGIKGVFVQAFKYVVQELGPVLKVVGAQIVELMKLVFEKYIKPHLMKLVMALIGPALFMGVARAAGAAILKVGFEKVLTGFVNKMPGIPGAGGAKGAKGAADAAGAAKGTGSFATDMKSFGTSMLKLAGAMAVVAVAVKLLMPIILSIAKDIENSGVSKESIAFTAVLLGIFGLLFIGIGKLVDATARSKINKEKIQRAAAIMAISSVVLLALIPVAMLAITALGGYSVEQISKTILVMGAFTLMFAAISLLVGYLGIVGKTIDKGLTQALIATAAIAVLMVAIGGVAWLTIKMLGGFTLSQITSTLVALGGMTILFGGVSLVIAGLALLGVAVKASAGAALAAVGIGLVVAGTILGMMVPFSQWLIGELGGYPKDKVEATFKIMDSMVGLFAAVTIMVGLIALAAKSLNWKSLAIMGVIMIAVYVAVKEIADFAKGLMREVGGINITPEKAQAVSTIFKGIADLITAVASAMATIGLSQRASVLGALIGIDLSAAFGDKLTPILPIIQTMVNTLITTVSGIQGNPEVLKAKAEVFSAIAKGIADILPAMGKLVATIAGAGSDSLLGVLVGADASKVFDSLEKIKTFTEGFLNSIFRTPDGIVPKIIQSFKDLTPAQVEGVKAGATLLGAFVPAIAELTKSLPETIRAVTGLVDELNTESDVHNVLRSIKDMITNIVSTMSSTISGIVGSIKTLLADPNITPEKLKAGEAIGNILKSVSELAKMFILSPEQLRQFRKTDSYFGSSENLDMSGLERHMNVVSSQINHLINGDPAHPENKGIKGIIDVIAAMTIDETKVKGVFAIAAIMETVGKVVPAIMETVKSASESVKDATLTPEQITARANMMTGIISSINSAITNMFSTIIPQLLTSIRDIDLPNIKGFDAKVKTIASVFDLIKSVSEISNSLQVTTTTAGGATTTSVRSVLDTINPVLNLLIGLFGMRTYGSGAGAVQGYGQTTLDALRAVDGFATMMPRGIASKIDTIKKTFEAIKSIVDASTALHGVSTGGPAISAQVLSRPLTNIANVITSLMSNEASHGVPNPLTHPEAFNNMKAIRDRIRGKGTIMTQLTQTLTEIMTGASRLSTLPEISTTASTNLATGLERVFGTSTNIANDQSILGKLKGFFGAAGASGTLRNEMVIITGNMRENILSPMRDMVNAYNRFSLELRRLGNAQPLDVTLNNLGTRLEARRRFEVTNAAVRAVINLNVRMDAGDLSRSLRTHTITRTNTTDYRAFKTSAFNEQEPPG